MNQPDESFINLFRSSKARKHAQVNACELHSGCQSSGRGPLGEPLPNTLSSPLSDTRLWPSHGANDPAEWQTKWTVP